jgi:hypothetical protein
MAHQTSRICLYCKHSDFYLGHGHSQATCGKLGRPENLRFDDKDGGDPVLVVVGFAWTCDLWKEKEV